MSGSQTSSDGWGWPGVERAFDLSGRVALVTGGSRGLGRAMVRGFARAGADVVIASRKLEACEEAAVEVRSLGREALAHACHVADWDALEGLVDAVYERFGRLDVLVNNAGMSPLASSSLETSEELYDKVLGVNLKGPFRLTALAGSRMAAAEGGSVINVSSTASIRPTPDTAPYAAAKAGLNALTVAYAHEFGPKVRVNCIMAGPFHTDVSRAWSRSEGFTRHARAAFALGRAGDPDEIVGTALYFASDASRFTSGAVLRVDGGTP
jgi:NAD(P)-dependent dehydrogenase (short-subunit alcohol dehydrogenase family)